MKHATEVFVTMERVRILYDTLTRQNIVTFSATVIIAYVYRAQFSTPLLLAWCGFMMLGISLRLWCQLNYKKNAVKLSDHRQYESYYIYANGVVGLGWAIFVALSLSLPSFTYRIYSILLLSAMVGMAVPVFMSSIKTLYAFILPPILVGIPLLLIRGGADSATGIAVLIYSLVIIRSGKYTYQTLLQSITERIYNQNLVKELEQTRNAKSESEKRVQSVIDYAPAAIYVKDINGHFIFLNQKVADICGVQRKDIIGKTLHDILPEAIADEIQKNDIEVITAGKPLEYEENIPQNDGFHHYISIKFPLFDETGNVYAVGGVSTDITERFRIEESLRRSQKMDAIGKLTGGIAHDFNNMLGVILGFSELIKTRLSNEDAKLIKYNDEVINAGERARKLTSKLLEFSRKAPSSAETTYINVLLHGMRHMLEKTLTPRIELIFELQENLWPVWLDKTRLEDAILNICINAMHAMPVGGTLSLTTSNNHIENSAIHDIDIMSGDYVLLSISDTGTGMSREIQQKIFDPFFTTKGAGGTGLGMSQVYGFVQQLGGGIQVCSEPGEGTRVVLYIPRLQMTETSRAEGNVSDLVKSISGQETILVVDDEVALLDLAEDMLTTHGYTVLRAENAEQALKILENKSVDLLLSDVIMRGMDGYQLATEVEKRYPIIKIQMVSGYNDEHNMNATQDTLHQRQMHKPLNSKSLLKRIRELLDEEK